MKETGRRSGNRSVPDGGSKVKAGIQLDVKICDRQQHVPKCEEAILWESPEIQEISIKWLLCCHAYERSCRRQVSQARTGANRDIKSKAFLQIPILSENQDRIAVFSDGFRLDGEIQSAVSPDGNDVDAVFFRISISPSLPIPNSAFRKISP